MRVGVALADITPPVGTRLSGFAGRPVPGFVSTGVRDPLRATVLWVEGALVVALDTIGLTPRDDRALRRRLARAVGGAPEAVLIACSHTHSGAATMTIRATGDKEVAWTRELFRRVEMAAKEAKASARSLVEARLGEESCDAAINRRRAEGPRDARVQTLLLQTDSGPLVTLVHFACHPVALGNQNTLLSADWVASLREHAEPALGCPTLFLQGCCGDINPRFGTSRGESEAARVGKEVAEAVLAAATASERVALTAPVAVHRRARLPLHPYPDHATLAEREQEAQGRLAALGRSDIDQGFLEWIAAVRKKTEREFALATVSRLTLGPLTLVGLPGEIFTEIGQALETDAWPIGFANGNLGYLYPDSALDEGGYEVTLAYKLYGEQQAGRGTAQALIRAAQTSRGHTPGTPHRR